MQALQSLRYHGADIQHIFTWLYQGQPSRLHTAAIWHNTANMETQEEEIDFASLSPEVRTGQEY